MNTTSLSSPGKRTPVGTHQNIFQLNVSVQEALAVQEADPLHHVQGDLKPLLKRQTSLEDKKKQNSPGQLEAAALVPT